MEKIYIYTSFCNCLYRVCNSLTCNLKERMGEKCTQLAYICNAFTHISVAISRVIFLAHSCDGPPALFKPYAADTLLIDRYIVLLFSPSLQTKLMDLLVKNHMFLFSLADSITHLYAAGITNTLNDPFNFLAIP